MAGCAPTAPEMTAKHREHWRQSQELLGVVCLCRGDLGVERDEIIDRWDSGRHGPGVADGGLYEGAIMSFCAAIFCTYV